MGRCRWEGQNFQTLKEVQRLEEEEEEDTIWYGIRYKIRYYTIYNKIYALTEIGLTPGGSSTVHIYTQTIRRTTQLTKWEECGPCPVFANYTQAFTFHLRKKNGKTSVSVSFNFIQGFRKIHKYKISWKAAHWGFSLSTRKGGGREQRDRHEANSHFSQFYQRA